MNATDFFNRIEDHWGKQRPLVVYKTPNASRVTAYLQNDSLLHRVSESTASGFVMGKFDTNEAPFLILDDEVLETEIDTQSPPQPTETVALPHNSKEYQRYIALLNQCIQEIQNTHLKKVVLSRSIDLPLKKVNPWELFQKAISLYPSAFCYIWYHPQKGIWLGATPETLFNLKNQQLSTMALAGTAIATDINLVQWSPKEIHEQELVTDSILKALRSLEGNETVTFTPAETVQAGSLFHLKSHIAATVTKASVWELVAALHPTPAVGGVPRKKAFDFIQKNEGYNRSFYSGYLGPISDKETHLFVNLRCLQWQPHLVTLYVGSGITAASNPQSEWEETQQKAQTMLRLISSTI
ncbi:MAG: isochorismate synthase [Flavobacteriaceae bacterium]|nr:isochorismate synthase [Flavobacteriaceae bacterium]MDG2315117.1 isochorismate synthase [Flavobacteriaceae bacterium]